MTALDLAVDGQHKACVDFLTSEQARTNGGQFHRSARLLQAWWRFRRYKVRLEDQPDYFSLPCLSKDEMPWCCMSSTVF